jgi:DNA polymerase kappa
MDAFEPLVYGDHAEDDEEPTFFTGEDDDAEDDTLPSINDASAPHQSSLDHERMLRPRYGPRPTINPSSSSDAPPSLSARAKPSPSSAPQPSSSRPATAQLLTCPVCARELETDNDGLNAHVDFCLSKGAIREAARETSVSPQKRPAKGMAGSPAVPNSKAGGWDVLFKPASKGGTGTAAGKRKPGGRVLGK